MTGSIIVNGIAIAAHLAVGGLYLASGLVMPYPWVFGMWVLWVIWSYALYRATQAGSGWPLLVPVAAVATWVLVVLVGEQVFGWSA